MPMALGSESALRAQTPTKDSETGQLRRFNHLRTIIETFPVRGVGDAAVQACARPNVEARREPDDSLQNEFYLA